jgi:hypothetical protein
MLNTCLDSYLWLEIDVYSLDTIYYFLRFFPSLVQRQHQVACCLVDIGNGLKKKSPLTALTGHHTLN